MKFVPRDKGASSENSSGGGSDGLLKETLYMLVAHWLLMVSVGIAVMAVIGVVALVIRLWA